MTDLVTLYCASSGLVSLHGLVGWSMELFGVEIMYRAVSKSPALMSKPHMDNETSIPSDCFPGRKFCIIVRTSIMRERSRIMPPMVSN